MTTSSEAPANTTFSPSSVSSSSSASSTSKSKLNKVRRNQQHTANKLDDNGENDDEDAEAAAAGNDMCNLCCEEFALPAAGDNEAVNHLFELETCGHSFCVRCLRQYLKFQITESRVAIACPQCSERLHPNHIYELLAAATCGDEGATLIRKYEEFMLRRYLVTLADTRWCPAPDCSYAVIATGCANCPQLHCMAPNCHTSFCYHCKQYWHPNVTCEDAAMRAALAATSPQSSHSAVLISASDLLAAAAAAAASTSDGAGVSPRSASQTRSSSKQSKLMRSLLQRSSSQISTAAAAAAATTSSTAATAILASRGANGDIVKEEIKRCPKCSALIVKMDDGSCNHITCSVCGCEFCWLCMKEISDLHYLSPSGCTFWGKKPWSPKKKIMWQLGTLIGAPVGIALIAGVAVPFILIGLPIWSARKVYSRYKLVSKHKRNLMVTGTALGAVLVAPLVATLVIGIGVPIMLAYVYGVVPISLFRSGGCGITTNNNGGVRLAFDDEPAPPQPLQAGAQQATVVTENTAASGGAGGGGKLGKNGKEAKSKSKAAKQHKK